MPHGTGKPRISAAMSSRRPAGQACEVSAVAVEALSGDLAAATRRAYLARLRAIEVRLGGGPLNDLSFSAVLADMAADGQSPSTLAQTVSAVRFAARRLDQPDPVGLHCDIVLRTHRRATGPPRQVAAIAWAAADSAAEVAAACDNLIGLRDAAIIAVMSDALLRVSETAALDPEHVHRAGDGSGHVTVRRSKTDQENAGVSLFLRRVTVIRIGAWRQAGGIDGGSLFRRIRKGGRVTSDRLTPRSIRSIIAVRAAAIGIEGASGHSMRVGAAQSLVGSGAQLPEAMLAGRWTSPAMIAHYAKAELAQNGAVSRLRPDTPERPQDDPPP